MKLLLDFIPIVLFFAAYKIKGIFVATGVAIIAAFFCFIITYWKTRKVDGLQVCTLLLMLILGGATLFFHNENFIKYKPSVLYGLMALAFFVSAQYSKQSLLQRLMGTALQLTPSHWKKLNSAWVAFFISMTLANAVVALYFDTNTWVNFKLFGTLSLTILFILAQACYIVRLQKNEQR